MINWDPPKPTAEELERRVQIARARGIRSQRESRAPIRAIGGGPNAATIGTPDPRGPIDPPVPSDPYAPGDPLYPHEPGTSSVDYLPRVGGAALWQHDRNNLFTNVRAQDAPFVVGTAPAGLGYQLDQSDVDALNLRYFGSITP